MTDVHTARDIRTSPELDQIATALALAQGEFPELKKEREARVSGKTKDGRQYDYGYKYADMSDVLAVVRPILAKHKICFTQPTVVEGGIIYLRTRLLHASGQWMESEYPVASYANNPHQRLGEALTYAKRYAGCALLGIHAEETVEGDDSAGKERGAAHVNNGGTQRPREAPTVVQGGEGSKPLPPKVGEFEDSPEVIERANEIAERDGTPPEYALIQARQELAGGGQADLELAANE